jgi:predicted aldo/keto reductase-like oxidoreductase
MIYKDFRDKKLSALGLGCMRLPTVDGQDAVIDAQAAGEMVRYAFDHGINYFDTAWMYHGGNSETVMGDILSQYPRESYYLASKFPGFSPETLSDPAKIFTRQLEKCKTEYFDFYLLHSVTDNNLPGYLDEKYGLIPYLLEQKKAGRIRHLGFSSHGSIASIRRLLEAYGEVLEFCQIQLNWLDWEYQNAKDKVALLNQYQIPIWVMEPVRGGRLVNLEEGHLQKLNALQSGVSAPEWAFRFLQGIQGVTMVLSGMSNMEQLSQNIATFETEKPLDQEQWDALMEIAAEMIAKNTVPCTGCSYCVEHCPMQIAIPEVIKLYNALADGGTQKPGTPGPADCVACGKCKFVCPQGIDIPKVMADYAAKL